MKQRELDITNSRLTSSNVRYLVRKMKSKSLYWKWKSDCDYKDMNLMNYNKSIPYQNPILVFCMRWKEKLDEILEEKKGEVYLYSYLWGIYVVK